MKITINDIAKIEHAEVMIQGISVLTGYNATGKSTVSKALNAIISAYTDVLQSAECSRLQSMRTALYGLMNKILSDRPYFILGDNLQLFLQEAQTKESRFPEDYEKFRELAARLDDNEELPEATSEINVEYRSFLEKSRTIQERPIGDYIRFVIERSILSAFDNQINTIGQTSLGRIVLSSNNGDMNCEVFFKGNRLQSCSYKRIKVPKPIYVKSKHSLDDLPTDGKARQHSSKIDPILSDLLDHNEDYAEWRTIEVHEKLDRILALIDEAIRGGLVENGESLQYMNEHSSPISLKNLASGNKTFAMIKRLLENGQLCKDRILIIDEPETNLHPKWQLILANILVILYKELGLKVFLNSHSPYFVRAVEVYTKRYDIMDRCFFYRTVQGKNGLYRVEDVTKETEKIYRTLYFPLEGL